MYKGNCSITKLLGSVTGPLVFSSHTREDIPLEHLSSFLEKVQTEELEPIESSENDNL